MQSLCGCKKGAYYGRMRRKFALVRLGDEPVTWMVIPKIRGLALGRLLIDDADGYVMS